MAYIDEFNDRPISKEDVFTIFSDHPDMKDRKAIIMHGFARLDEHSQKELFAEMQQFMKEFDEIEQHIDNMSAEI